MTTTVHGLNKNEKSIKGPAIAGFFMSERYSQNKGKMIVEN